MKHLVDIGFWFTAAFSVATIAILISSVRIKGRGFLLSFIVLSVLSSATNYFPLWMLQHQQASYTNYRKQAKQISYSDDMRRTQQLRADYANVSVAAEVVAPALRCIAWATLFVFAIGLRGNVQQAPRIVARKAGRADAIADPMTISWALFSFDGRLCRSDYWRKGFFPLLPVSFLNFALMYVVRTDWAFNMAVFISLASLWPGLALITKRLHDRDQPAWYMLIMLIPMVGPILLVVGVWFMKGTDGPNRFGPDPLQAGAAPGGSPVLASV